MTIIYGLFIYAYWLATGNQQYSFLDFSTGDGFKNLFLINIISVIVYIIFCTVDEKIKPINDTSSISTYS